MTITHSVISYKKLNVPMSDMHGNIKQNVITQVLLRITGTENNLSRSIDCVANLEATDFTNFIEEENITADDLLNLSFLRMQDMHQVHGVLVNTISANLSFYTVNDTEVIVEL